MTVTATNPLLQPLSRDKLVRNGPQLGVEADLQPSGIIVLTFLKCRQTYEIYPSESVTVGAVVCPSKGCNKPRTLRAKLEFAQTFGDGSVV